MTRQVHATNDLRCYKCLTKCYLPTYYRYRLLFTIIFHKYLKLFFIFFLGPRCMLDEGEQVEGAQCHTLQTPISAEFCRHCMLNGRTQRRSLPQHQSEEIKILNNSYSRMGIERTTCCVYSHTFVPLRQDWPLVYIRPICLIDNT